MADPERAEFLDRLRKSGWLSRDLMDQLDVLTPPSGGLKALTDFLLVTGRLTQQQIAHLRGRKESDSSVALGEVASPPMAEAVSVVGFQRASMTEGNGSAVSFQTSTAPTPTMHTPPPPPTPAQPKPPASNVPSPSAQPPMSPPTPAALPTLTAPPSPPPAPAVPMPPTSNINPTSAPSSDSQLFFGNQSPSEVAPSGQVNQPSKAPFIRPVPAQEGPHWMVWGVAGAFLHVLAVLLLLALVFGWFGFRGRGSDDDDAVNTSRVTRPTVKPMPKPPPPKPKKTTTRDPLDDY